MAEPRKPRDLHTADVFFWVLENENRERWNQKKVAKSLDVFVDIVGDPKSKSSSRSFEMYGKN